MGSQTESQLSVVNLTDMRPGTDAWRAACHVVRSALEDYGCFVARYDKMGKELCDSVVSAMEELYGLPLETKKQETSDKPFHGYSGQVSWLPLYESVGIDDPVTWEGCQKFTHVMWPVGNDHFCERVNAYAKLMEEVDHIAKRMVFDSYGVDMKRGDSLIEASNYLLRSLKYRAPEVDEGDLGMHSHSDLSILSVLHQLNNLNGLEIKLMDGEWTGVDASHNLFVVMAGDGFKVWSNGRIRPCEHRVIMNAKKTRYSMGLFSFSGKTVEVPEELVDEQHPLHYKPFDHYEYLRFFEREKIKESDPRLQAYCGV